ncbi:MAG: hypothetical protein WC997_03240 [Porticoccaceae bacterium]
MEADQSEVSRYIQQLSLPGDSRESLSFCPATPEGLKAYLEQLAHGNPTVLCNQLYQLLPEIAALQVPPGRKLALLDLACPEAIQCVEHLTKDLAITPATTKLLSLSIAMLRYLAQGYKSVLVNTLQLPAAAPNLMINSCYAAINVLSQILMECWECYIQPPRHTWQEIHALFAIARLSQLETVSITSQKAAVGIGSTIKASYMRPLLLACADPFRYTPQDLRQIAAFLASAGNLVDFAGNHGEGIFVVDPDSDRGPQYSFKAGGTTQRHFRLKTERLVKHLEQKAVTGTFGGLPRRLAKELSKYWSREIKRREDPVNDNSALTIVVGLSHIHRQLTGCATIESYIAQLHAEGRHAGFTLQDRNDSDLHRDTFLKQDHFANSTAFRDKPIEYLVEDNRRPLRKYVATRINYSTNGARIALKPQGETLYVGELIGMQLHGSTDWLIGLVRWTRVSQDLTRSAGIEIISTRPVPCVVSQFTAGSQEQRQYYPGILTERGARPCVIAPALPFQEYAQVQIETRKSKRNLQLLETLEETYHVAAFGLPSSL